MQNGYTLIIPIIAALISAVLGTLLGQAIERNHKVITEKQREAREIISKSFNLKIVLKDLFRQLALQKFHVEFWYHSYKMASTTEFGMKYYDEHLRAQKEARDVEKAIWKTTAAFLAEVVRYEIIIGQKFNVSKHKETVEAISFCKAKTYNDTVSIAVLRDSLAEDDEEELRIKYFDNLTPFLSIITEMKISYEKFISEDLDKTYY